MATHTRYAIRLSHPDSPELGTWWQCQGQPKKASFEYAILYATFEIALAATKRRRFAMAVERGLKFEIVPITCEVPEGQVTKPKSDRQALAERVAAYIVANELNRPFGGDVSLYRGGKVPCYVTAFSQPRVLDGTVSIFAPNFIQVRFNTSYRALPASDSRVFTSEQAALDFLRLAFVERNFEAALAIPTR